MAPVSLDKVEMAPINLDRTGPRSAKLIVGVLRKDPTIYEVLSIAKYRGVETTSLPRSTFT
jgi:hypothetical protein